MPLPWPMCSALRNANINHNQPRGNTRKFNSVATLIHACLHNAISYFEQPSFSWIMLPRWSRSLYTTHARNSKEFFVQLFLFLLGVRTVDLHQADTKKLLILNFSFPTKKRLSIPCIPCAWLHFAVFPMIHLHNWHVHYLDGRNLHNFWAIRTCKFIFESWRHFHVVRIYARNLICLRWESVSSCQRSKREPCSVIRTELDPNLDTFYYRPVVRPG